jgi:hypothetical protein
VNVEATGAVYDFRADELTSTTARGLVLQAQGTEADEAGTSKVTATVRDRAGELGEVVCRLEAPGGVVRPAQVTTAPGAAGAQQVSFAWDTTGLQPGLYRCWVSARASGEQGATVTRPVTVRVPEWPTGPLRLVEVRAAAAAAAGEPYQVTAKLTNISADQPATVDVECVLLTARRPLPLQKVTVAPGSEMSVTWVPSPGEPAVAPGTHTVRVVVRGQRGLTGTAEFVAR